MKTAYFDCFSGASGDMILGALVDAGLNLDQLKQALTRLNLTGFDLTAKKNDTLRTGLHSGVCSASGKGCTGPKPV